MVQALIRINGVNGSNPPNGTPLVIGAVINVTNVNTGGELTYLWEFVDKPEGSTASFAAPASQSTTFTPDVEGTYLIRQTVNRTLASERVDTQIAAISQIKTGQRIPAAGEMLQANTTRGWAEAVNRQLQELDSTRADNGLMVAVAKNATSCGRVVKMSGVVILKPGLPGEEAILQCDEAPASSAADMALPLGVLVMGVNGDSTPAGGDPCWVRTSGVFGPFLGAPAVGDPVYVDDSAIPSLTPGTHTREIGYVAELDVPGATYWLNITDGAGGGIGSDPVLMYGPFTAPNGRSTKALPASLVFKGSSDITPVVIQLRDAADTSDLEQWQDAASAVIAAVRADGAVQTSDVVGFGSLTLYSTGANNIRFSTNGTTRWAVTANGTLYAVDAQHLVSGLLPPVSSDDAANKAYVDAQIPILYFGNTVSATAEHALDPGFGARTSPVTSGSYPKMMAPRAGTISKLRLRMETQPTGAAIQYEVYINGGASGITVTTSSGGGSEEKADLVHTAAVAAGDKITVIGKPVGVVTGGAIDVIVSFQFSGV